MPDAPARPVSTGRAPLGRTVWALALVSLLTDLSSEMIYPLLPLFLTATLGAGAATLGAIEGAAETTAALLKLASGWWSDRMARRKPLVVLGYGLASAARPLVALAGSAGQVLLVRLVDRVGKGIRSSPRDALLAAAVPAARRGRAFGFHRAADHLGAVLGPLAAFALLRGAGADVRTVFALAAVPAALAMAALVLGVREAAVPAAAPPAAPAEPAPAPVRPRGPGAAALGMRGVLGGRAAPGAGRPLAALLAAVTLFALGNSADAFLILRAAQLGVPTATVPLLWALLHVVRSASSTPGGALSDRVGRRPLIAAGWAVYAAVYLGFAAAGAAWQAWALFAAYGLVSGLTEGAEKALVADLAPAAGRGTAFGWYHAAVGAAALPASLLFGVVWERYGAPAAFRVGAGLAGAAIVILVAGARPAGGTPAGSPG